MQPGNLQRDTFTTRLNFKTFAFLSNACTHTNRHTLHETPKKQTRVPRAALTADELAPHCDFLSFGTNDLTQMTCGFSRDDAGSFLKAYVEHGLYPADPFQTIDDAGVGKLMRVCVALSRAVKPGIDIGICGEHGGDPDSIALCHQYGLDNISCSPYRVPVARLAAAQAAIRFGGWLRSCGFCWFLIGGGLLKIQKCLLGCHSWLVNRRGRTRMLHFTCWWLCQIFPLQSMFLFWFLWMSAWLLKLRLLSSLHPQLSPIENCLSPLQRFAISAQYN